MTITCEQVANLNLGDVVEIAFDGGTTIRGPLTEDRHVGGLEIAEAGWMVRNCDGDIADAIARYAESLTVVSRAPRPLYTNSARTTPAVGDIARDSLGSVWMMDDENDWGTVTASGWAWSKTDQLLQPLALLVDGETGEVVK